MPKYRFRLNVGGVSKIDTADYPDLAKARAVAIGYAGTILAEQKEDFWSGDGVTLEVSDESNLTLFAITTFATNAPAVRR